MNLESKFAHIKELYLPYEFKLLLRGSRDSGFTPDRFHAICDNIPRTVAFIKLKETDLFIYLFKNCDREAAEVILWRSLINTRV